MSKEKLEEFKTELTELSNDVKTQYNLEYDLFLEDLKHVRTGHRFAYAGVVPSFDLKSRMNVIVFPFDKLYNIPKENLNSLHLTMVFLHDVGHIYYLYNEYEKIPKEKLTPKYFSNSYQEYLAYKFVMDYAIEHNWESLYNEVLNSLEQPKEDIHIMYKIALRKIKRQYKDKFFIKKEELTGYCI